MPREDSRLPPDRPPARLGHAVVVGASMAGLLAGRVLADHCDRVTIVEKDRLPDTPQPRKGVPQTRHIHVLLVRGRGILEQLFPGLNGELADLGVEAIDAGQDFAWLTPAGWSLRFHADLGVLACSRDLLDAVIRRRLRAFDRVTLRDGTEVTGLVPGRNGTAVAGVTICRRTHEDDGGTVEEAPLEADLVVDAGGRGSRTPEWLAGLGYPTPEETWVSAQLGYASRVYRRPAGRSFPWKCIYLQAAPPQRTRAGVVFPIEDDRWVVTLGGGGGDYPPTDEAGFRAFMESLPSPILIDAVGEAEPLSAIAGYRATQNRWRHYERLTRRPEGLLVLGDAACTFNPVYGQGMTTAALGAATLDEYLGRHGGNVAGLARRFQQSLAKVNQAPWLLATSEDFRYATTEGATPTRATRWMHRYLDRLVARSTTNADLRRVLLQVLHLIRPSSALLRPGVVAKVFFGRLPKPPTA